MKKLSILLVAVIVILGIAYPAYCSYVAGTIMKVPQLPVEGSPADEGLDYEDVEFFSSVDSIVLKGWYIPGNNSCIIIVNGGFQNRNDKVTGTLELTQDLSQYGYSILLFDLRGRGESEGKARTLMYVDKDVNGAISYVRNRGCTDICIIGFSAGAAALATTSVSADAMIFDSCFADVRDMFLRLVVDKGYPEFFGRLISPGTFLMARILYGYQAVNPVDKIKDVDCPILFIHGMEDEGVLPDNSIALYNSRNNPQDELCLVNGAGHTLSYRLNPLRYVSKVNQFLEVVR